MRKLLFFVFMLTMLVTTTAYSQQIDCVVFTPATVAKMNAYHIPVSTGLKEYMTTLDLAAAYLRAAHCVVPKEQSMYDIGNAIVWRIAKFAGLSQQRYRSLGEFSLSAGHNTITPGIALTWLKYNHLDAQFAAWDEADVQHNWAALTKPGQSSNLESLNARTSPGWHIDKYDGIHTNLYFFTEGRKLSVQEDFKNDQPVYVALYIPDAIKPEREVTQKALLIGSLPVTISSKAGSPIATRLPVIKTGLGWAFYLLGNTRTLFAKANHVKILYPLANGKVATRFWPLKPLR